MKALLWWALLIAPVVLLMVSSEQDLAAGAAGPGGAAAALIQVDCSCRYTVNTTDFSFSSSGGPGRFTVTAASPTCEWDARSDDSWITVVNGEDHQGTEGTVTVNFTVAANPGTIRRDGIITVRRARMCPVAVNIAVHQGAGCAVAINPAGAHLPAAGGSGSFDAAAAAGCPPPVVLSSQTWIAAAASGSMINYTVQQNNGPARQGVVWFDNPSLSTGFMITQDAFEACPASSFSLSPTSATFDSDGGERQLLHVEVPISCGNWAAVSTAQWITVDPIPGIGSRFLGYSVERNLGSWRSGTIMIGAQQFWVYQNAGDCPASLICFYFPAACGTAGASSAVLDVSHSFRDKILARSTRGRQYTRLYYQFSREAVRIMLSNPMLLVRSRDVITRYKPVLESMVKGEPVNLSGDDLNYVDDFLRDFSEKGSSELKDALIGLRNDLRDPEVHKEFGITLVDGPKREAAATNFSQNIEPVVRPWLFIGGCGLIFGGLIRKRRPRIVKSGKRRLFLLVPAAMIVWSVSPLSARPRQIAQASIFSPRFSYLTYLGGSGDDQGTAIAADSEGNAYVAGITNSANFPISGASQGALAGGQQDAFVSKISPSGKLVYSTYLGGADQDSATAITVDSAGNAYVAGFTSSKSFPVKNAFQRQLKGEVNAFVTKLDPAGSVVYSTYLGGSLADIASGIAIDSSGNAYVSGVTSSSDFPIVGAIQASLGGGSNAFVAKLSSDGSRLMYSTYLGGRDTDGASGVAVDSAGQAYITGVTSSRNFTAVNAVQRSHGGGFFDAFAAKLNAAGDRLLYWTYLGGTGEDRGLRIAADNDGNAYVVGDTDSTDLATINGLQPTRKGASDVFVAKLNPAGSAFMYLTYLGGSGLDGGTGIAVDSGGSAYVTGFTGSTDFPTTNSLQPAFGGGTFDSFVAKLNGSGSALEYSTYLGGVGIDSGFGVAVDLFANAYVMGQSNSTNLPTISPTQGSYGGGSSDVFVARIRPDLKIVGASQSGKKLIVTGSGFDAGSRILINSEAQKTTNDSQQPGAILIAKKAGKHIKPGQNVILQVRNSDGTLSNEFSFTRPAG